jgi:hypothetical protein
MPADVKNPIPPAVTSAAPIDLGNTFAVPRAEWRLAEPLARLRPAAPQSDLPGAAAESSGERKLERAPRCVAAVRRPRWATRPNPGPPSVRMLALCAWATAIGVLGLAVGGWALAATAKGVTPSWYEPTLAAVGTAGVLFTAGAFATERWKRLPWLMLGLATVPAVGNIGLAVIGAL